MQCTSQYEPDGMPSQRYLALIDASDRAESKLYVSKGEPDYKKQIFLAHIYIEEIFKIEKDEPFLLNLYLTRARKWTICFDVQEDTLCWFEKIKKLLNFYRDKPVVYKMPEIKVKPEGICF